MDFGLPDETTALRDALDSWSRRAAPAGEVAEHSKALREFGLFELSGARATDTEHASLNVAVALEALGRAGLTGPVVETLFATYAGLVDQSTEVTWVAGGSHLRRGGRTLVPYGQVSGMVLAGQPGLVEAVPAAGEPAHVIMQDRHTWQAGVPAFEEIAAAFAWRNMAALTVGYCDRISGLALRQLDGRIAFGKPIVSYQAPRFRLAESYWRVEGLRSMVLDAAWRADASDPRATFMAALAWTYAARAGKLVARNVHQVMGAIGFIDEAGVVGLTGALASMRLTLHSPLAARAAWDGFDRDSAHPASNLLNSSVR
jgi:alkylation response protein AidB-like acyl-CoA dehydrogenase